MFLSSIFHSNLAVPFPHPAWWKGGYLKIHLQADCLYTGISAGLSAQ